MNSSDAIQILNGFSKQRVLVIGDVMLDRYVWGRVTRVSPEAPVPIVAKQRTTSSPGGAANVAATLAALNGNAVLVSAAGDGSDGRDLQIALSERGVNPADVILSPCRRTTVKTRIIAHNQHLLRIDDEDTDPVDEELNRELLIRIEAALCLANVVVLSDYAKGLLTPQLVSAIIMQARERGLPVLVDPKGSDYSRYNGASVLTPNRAEAFLAAGLPQECGLSVVDAGGRLMETLAIGALLITEGESGMTLFERPNSVLHLPASARVVYDVTGAGDTVIATLALALAAGATLNAATYLANLAGGLAVEQVGTATITIEAIESVFHDTRHCLPTFSEVRIAQAMQ